MVLYMRYTLQPRHIFFYLCISVTWNSFQEWTALKSLEERTVKEYVKMGHVFKGRLPPSDASVTQDSLVSSSFSATRCYNIDRSSDFDNENTIFERNCTAGIPARLAICFYWCFLQKAGRDPSFIRSSMSFAWKGKLSVEKVMGENWKATYLSKDQHFLILQCYICHHNIWSSCL